MQQFRLQASPSLHRLKLVLYILVMLATGLYFLPSLTAVLLIALMGLLMQRDFAQYRQSRSLGPTTLTLRDNRITLEASDSRQALQFERFRIFSNRWFLILQLRSRSLRQDFMLVADRFQSVDDYLNFRYQILDISRQHHVA